MVLYSARVRAICFDVDGTLSDSDDQYLELFIPWLRPLAPLTRRSPRTMARWLVYSLEDPGTWLLGLADRLGLDKPLDRVSSTIDRLRRKPRSGSFQAIPGVHDLLQGLSTRYPLAVVSARGERKTLAFLDICGLSHFFAVVVTGQTCRRTKPHPEPLLYAANKIGVAPAELLMVGDTTIDIRAGRAAGAQTVGVLCGFGREEELRRAGADVILNQTGELAKLLDSEPKIGRVDL